MIAFKYYFTWQVTHQSAFRKTAALPLMRMPTGTKRERTLHMVV